MDKLTLAYLAGCMDSDGYFTIRSDSYEMRMGKRKSCTFQEQVGLRQVTPVVPGMLKDIFGGNLYITKSSTANGKAVHSWHVNSRKAAAVCLALLPYLRIKPAQAKVLLELRRRKDLTDPSRKKDGTFRETELAEQEIRRQILGRVRALNKVGVLI